MAKYGTQTESYKKLSAKNKEAMDAGMSYGKYVAMQYAQMQSSLCNIEQQKKEVTTHA